MKVEIEQTGILIYMFDLCMASVAEEQTRGLLRGKANTESKTQLTLRSSPSTLGAKQQTRIFLRGKANLETETQLWLRSSQTSVLEGFHLDSTRYNYSKRVPPLKEEGNEPEISSFLDASFTK